MQLPAELNRNLKISNKSHQLQFFPVILFLVSIAKPCTQKILRELFMHNSLHTSSLTFKTSQILRLSKQASEMRPKTNQNEFPYVHMMNFIFERFFYHFTITTLRKAINSDYFDGVSGYSFLLAEIRSESR